MGIDLDAHGRLGAAADENLADAFHLRQLLSQDRVGGVVEAADLERVGGEPEDQDRRVGRVDLAVGRVVGQPGRQLAARRIDGGLHVAGGGVDAAVEIELQHDRAVAQETGRCHLGHAGDAAELPLQRGRHRRGHRLGAGARQLRLHLDDRKLDLRQRGDRQRAIGDDAGQQQRDAQQRGRDRPANERFGDVQF